MSDLDELGKKIDAARAKNNPQSAQPSQAVLGGKGLQIGSELIAAVLIGLAMGVGLDRLTGLAPLFMLIFLFIGFAAGIINIKRHLDEESDKMEHDS